LHVCVYLHVQKNAYALSPRSPLFRPRQYIRSGLGHANGHVPIGIYPESHVQFSSLVLSRGDVLSSGHFTCTLSPVQYEPDVHSLHTVSCQKPGRHTQSCASSDPAGDVEFAMHTPSATPTPQYLPAGHNTHAPPSGPEKPALHWQAVAAVLCTGEFEFAGQVVQQLTFTFFRL